MNYIWHCWCFRIRNLFVVQNEEMLPQWNCMCVCVRLRILTRPSQNQPALYRPEYFAPLWVQWQHWVRIHQTLIRVGKTETSIAASYMHVCAKLFHSSVFAFWFYICPKFKSYTIPLWFWCRRRRRRRRQLAVRTMQNMQCQERSQWIPQCLVRRLTWTTTLCAVHV